MHKQLSVMVSAGGSPGRLAILAKALGQQGINITHIGGAEWDHSGPVVLMIEDDSASGMVAFAGALRTLKYKWLSFSTVSVRLTNVPGELGRAAEAVDDINIYGVLVLSSNDDEGFVGLGVRRTDADTVVSRLRAADPPFEAEVLKHPDEPIDPGPDEWDDRTESLLPFWEPDRFWEFDQSS